MIVSLWPQEYLALLGPKMNGAKLTIKIDIICNLALWKFGPEISQFFSGQNDMGQIANNSNYILQSGPTDIWPRVKINGAKMKKWIDKIFILAPYQIGPILIWPQECSKKVWGQFSLGPKWNFFSINVFILAPD